MSNDRRRQRRREQRRRSSGRSAYEPVGQVEFPGIMGVMQRNMKLFFLGGIIVMVLSLGGIIFASQLDATADPDSVPTPSPTPEATATPDDAEAEDEIVRSYNAAPEMTIDPDRRYEAVIRTDRGDVRIELYPDEAPGYVNNFVFLAQNRFYEGLIFHRVVSNFVAQAGDPSASGFGDAGYSLPEETNDLRFEPGVLSMAKAGNRVSSSQFFITTGPAPHLQGGFTVFGRVLEGLDVLQSFEPRDPADPNAPEGVQIRDIEIIEGEPAAADNGGNGDNSANGNNGGSSSGGSSSN